MARSNIPPKQRYLQPSPSNFDVSLKKGGETQKAPVPHSTPTTSHHPPTYPQPHQDHPKQHPQGSPTVARAPR